MELSAPRGSRHNREAGEQQYRKLPKAVQLLQEIQEIVKVMLPISISDVEAHLALAGRLDLTVHKDFERIATKIVDARKIMSLGVDWETIMETLPVNHFKPEDYLTIEESKYWFKAIMNHNRINQKEFVENVYDLMNRRKPKKNALFIMGQPNGGKSLVANSIARSSAFYSSCQNFNGKSTFEFAGMLFQRSALINEAKLTDLTIETMKLIAEGLPVQIDVKFKGSQLLRRTPLIITGNQELFFYTTRRDMNEKAFKARCFNFNFNSFGKLVECSHDFHPLMWLDLLREFKLIE